MLDPHSNEQVMFSVQEWMRGGSLDIQLWDVSYTAITWRQRLQWARDIAEGMAFMHSKATSLSLSLLIQAFSLRRLG